MAGAAAIVGLLGAVVCLPLLAVLAAGGGSAPATGVVGGIPDRVLAAYRAADGWCPGLRWQLLAGIGAVESGHGGSGGATVDEVTGEVAPPIYGVALDGSPGVAALPIGPWLGWFGLAGPWQRAVVISGWDRVPRHVSSGALSPRVIGVSAGCEARWA